MDEQDDLLLTQKLQPTREETYRYFKLMSIPQSTPFRATAQKIAEYDIAAAGRYLHRSINKKLPRSNSPNENLA